MSGADVSSRSYSEAAMKLREALIAQSPSLELQRAAANEIARLDAQIAAIRKYVTDPRRVEYSDKIVHPFNGASFQNWCCEIYMPDPLPDPYDRSDLDRHRLTPEQAFDRWLANLVRP